VEARISGLLEEGKWVVTEKDNLSKELNLTQRKLIEMEERTPECNYGNLEKQVRNLERQLEDRAPEQTELAGHLVDAQVQLEIMRQILNEYREQVNRILRLTERSSGGGGHQEEKEENSGNIVHFTGEDRKELRGWQVQLALRIAGKPKTFNTEQKKLWYTVC
jgi:chromosome segregation ATPase